MRCTSCAYTPLPPPRAAKGAPPLLVPRKPGTTQCAGRLNLLAHQRNLRRCWCKCLQAFRRTPPPYAAVLCAAAFPGAMMVRGSLAGGPSWARKVLVLL
jgi:hypothetical protein